MSYKSPIDTVIIFSVPRNGQLDLLQDIFRHRYMVMVRIRIRVSVNMVTVRMGTENSPCRVYLSVSEDLLIRLGLAVTTAWA